MLSRSLLPLLSAIIIPLFAYHLIISRSMSDDKKQLFAQLLSDYQRLQALEKQYPVLRDYHRDDVDFELTRSKIEQKIAQLKAAQAAKNTTQAPTLKAPNAEEDVTFNEFSTRIERWAYKQSISLTAVKSGNKATTTISTKSLAAQLQNAKGENEKGGHPLKVLSLIAGDLLSTITKDEITVGEITVGEIAQNFKTVLKNSSQYTTKKVYKSDEQHETYDVALFDKALIDFDPACWLMTAAGISCEPITPMSEADFVAGMSSILKKFSDSLQIVDTDSSAIFDATGTRKKWEELLANDDCGIFTDLLNLVKSYESNATISLRGIKERLSNRLGEPPYSDLKALHKKCSQTASVSKWLISNLGQDLGSAILTKH